MYPQKKEAVPLRAGIQVVTHCSLIDAIHGPNSNSDLLPLDLKVASLVLFACS